MKYERRKRYLRARCLTCRGALKVREVAGKWRGKSISCICKPGGGFRFSRPRRGGKVRK